MRSFPTKADIQAAIARNRDRRLLRVAARASEKYLNAFHNLNYDMNTNGEALLLRRLALASGGCVFDVGANLGDWTRTIKSLYPSVIVHAFEIDSATAAQLSSNLVDLTGVVVVPQGLSDAEGSVTIRSYPDAPVVTSMFDYPHPLTAVEKDAQVTTGERYVEGCGIEHLDFVKIDAEGAELKVLRGFEQMLAARQIDVVQFEYGLINAVTGDLLRDLYELLESKDYTVGKLFPNGVQFRPYEPADEDFRGPNYVAVARGQVDLIRRLSIP